MEKSKKNNKPASHSPNNFKDQSSIGLLLYLLAENKIAARLEHHDTWPNIDGYMDIQDNNNILIGSFWVQVKTLPDSNLSLPLEEDKFWVFCDEVAIQPVIVFGIDKTTQKAYWKHIYNVDYRKHGGKTIHFDAKKYISLQESSDFIDEWKKILSEYKSKFREYDKLKNEYNTLLTYSNPALGKENIDFMNIHQFLDEYNRLLDGPFNIIKRIYYPKSWKLGFAYYHYNKEQVKYFLYPIPLNFNDIQIKEVTEELGKKLGWTLNFRNDIKHNPITYAKGLIKNRILNDILPNKLLNHTSNIFLAQEVIITFIDKFKILPELGVSSEYTLSEIEQYIITNDLEKQIETKNPQQVMHKNYFHILTEMLEFLKTQKIDRIKRVYKPINSKEDIEFNLRVFFENLESVYKQIIKNNFPLLENELLLFDCNFDTLIIIFDPLNDAPGIPRYKLIYLQSLDKKTNLSFKFISNEEDKKIFNFFHNIPNNILYEDREYKCVNITLEGTEFLFNDFSPMLSFIYDILKQNFEKHFRDY